MLVALTDARTPGCGAKAGVLGRLLRAGLAVPDGVVVPLAVHRGAPSDEPPTELRDQLARWLATLGDPPVAVRSSATDEDGTHASAAGQYATVLAVRGADAVVAAVRTCWASARSARATAYRHAAGPGPAMGVLVQRLVDADVAGVTFTDPDGSTRIEASWGLGTGVVGGTVTPDAYRVGADDAITRSVGDKRTRTDRDDAAVVTHAVPDADRTRPTLTDDEPRRVAHLGRRVADLLGGPQDVEWALAKGTLWLLQARPVTAAPPEPAPTGPAPTGPAPTGPAPTGPAPTGPAPTGPAPTGPAPTGPAPTGPAPTGPGPREAGPTAAAASSGGDPRTLTGTPGSRGTATGPARVVRGPADFGRVQPGDVLVCPWTDPAWTPLLNLAAAVVTATGGVLSHAAIVARERGVPAVLGVADATTLHDGVVVTVDGDAGTVTLHTPTP